MSAAPPTDTRTAELHQLIGQALWDVQEFEETLAQLIALVHRVPMEASLEEARSILDEIRGATLGKLLRELRNVLHIDASFEPFLRLFLDQRNWMVHNSWRSHRNYLEDRQTYVDLRYRVHRLSIDAVEFSEFFGKLIKDWGKEQGVPPEAIEQLASYTYRRRNEA